MFIDFGIFRVWCVLFLAQCLLKCLWIFDGQLIFSFENSCLLGHLVYRNRTWVTVGGVSNCCLRDSWGLVVPDVANWALSNLFCFLRGRCSSWIAHKGKQGVGIGSRHTCWSPDYLLLITISQHFFVLCVVLVLSSLQTAPLSIAFFPDCDFFPAMIFPHGWLRILSFFSNSEDLLFLVSWLFSFFEKFILFYGK